MQGHEHDGSPSSLGVPDGKSSSVDVEEPPWRTDDLGNVSYVRLCFDETAKLIAQPRVISIGRETEGRCGVEGARPGRG